jgi:hypothetical protein
LEGLIFQNYYFDTAVFFAARVGAVVRDRVFRTVTAYHYVTGRPYPVLYKVGGNGGGALL